MHEWIILDGDIDAEWIETMNTVMDDNKILTLVSSERIPLTPPMRLLFEIADLRNASPATVSRAGVIFINDDDIGWQPFVQTWLDGRADETERASINGLVNKYVPKVRYGRCPAQYSMSERDLCPQPSLKHGVIVPKALLAVLKQFKMTVPIVQVRYGRSAAQSSMPALPILGQTSGEQAKALSSLALPLRVLLCISSQAAALLAVCPSA
eukprot:SAG22_NODE_38_length_26325_cov_107.302067_24_plen_210_part_00